MPSSRAIVMSDDASSDAIPLRSRARFAEIRAEISGRLWPVNSGMSSEAFNELMDQMARLQLNFELRDAAGMAGQVNTREGPSDRRRGAPSTPASGVSSLEKDDPPK